MRKYVLLFFSSLSIVFSAKAQDQGDYRQKFTEGNYLILEGNFSIALKIFLEAYKIDSSNANINYKIGFCYLKTVSEKNKSLSYLEKAVLNTTEKYTDMEPREKAAPIHAYYYYGQALHLDYKFDDAIANYEKFKSFLRPKQIDLIKDVNRQIEMSNNAKAYVVAPINVIIKNLGDSINTPYPEYSPVISADEKTLIFTSRRPGSTGGDKTIEDEFYEDIYISYRKPDSSWTTPVTISTNINTVSHEATVGLTADAQTLLIYKDSNGGDIYSSNLDGNNWSTPEAMGSNINTASWETSACLTPDGSTLYFVSDRSGGLGGRDIWKCIKLPNGKWSLAVNMGTPINTEYDEESPFIHPSGNVLFFSSKGHKSIGGFDIFFSTKGENGWDEPLNIGYPINTTDDDVFYVTSPDGKRGYYSSSSRPEGYGEKDLYVITIAERKKQPLALIKGFIIPTEGTQLPPNLEIVATNNESGIVTGTYRPLIRDGSFTIIIPPGSNYTLSYTNDGEEFFNEVMEVPADAAYQEINREVRLKAITFGDSVPKDTTATVTTNNNISFISVEGKLLDGKNAPFASLKVNLLNSKGEIVKSTTTNDLGWFIFTELSPGDDYLVALDENDTHIISKKSNAEFKDNKGNILKTKNISGKYSLTTSKTSVTFKTNKPVKDLTINNSNINNSNINNNNNNTEHEALSKVDKLNFQMNFKYNVTQIDVNDSQYKQFIENLMDLYQKNGSLNITLVSSSSQVPTRAYKTNKELSVARSGKAKEQLTAALKEKGVDESKINFIKIRSFVDGPQYNIDYLINKEMYEKFQYVKIGAK